MAAGLRNGHAAISFAFPCPATASVRQIALTEVRHLILKVTTGFRSKGAVTPLWAAYAWLVLDPRDSTAIGGGPGKPGVYGAEAASRYHYRAAAGALSREQAARLAACIPAPRRRRPAAIIENRMRQMGY